MASYNKVILMGNLVRDPELGQIPNSGTTVCEFTLAVNRRWKDGKGEQREETLFIDCSAFGKPGQAIGTHLKKGRPIHIEGHLKLDTWEAQDGSKRSKVRVIVEQFRFVDGGRSDGEGGQDEHRQATGTDNTARRAGKNGKGKKRARSEGEGRGEASEGTEARKEEGIPF